MIDPAVAVSLGNSYQLRKPCNFAAPAIDKDLTVPSGNQISANLLRLQPLWSVKWDRRIVLQGKCPGLYLDFVRPPTLSISNGVGSLAVRNCSTACRCLESSWESVMVGMRCPIASYHPQGLLFVDRAT